MPELQHKVTAALATHLEVEATLEEEVAPAWLVRPGAAQLGTLRPLAQEVYGALTGMTYPDEVPPRERRRLDMIVTYSDGTRRIVEFDEKQHFTEARLTTLAFYDELDVAFNVDEWRLMATLGTGREPGGGFAAPRPPLFPGGGGRHRQRAFRDFLADALRLEHEGWLPTARIHHREATAALASEDPREAMRLPWMDRVPDVIAESLTPPWQPIAAWWPTLHEKTRRWLRQSPFSPLNDYVLAEVRRGGGPRADSAHWTRQRDDPAVYLPQDDLAWLLANVPEPPSHRTDAPDPRAAYFRRGWHGGPRR